MLTVAALARLFTMQPELSGRGRVGKGVDTYRMRVDAYVSGEKTLEGGNIQIHR